MLDSDGQVADGDEDLCGGPSVIQVTDRDGDRVLG